MATAPQDVGVTKKKIFKILFPIALFCFLLYLPPTAFGIDNLSVIEQRVIALFFLLQLSGYLNLSRYLQHPCW